uniref:Neuropeptide-Like Protein n=1 Tax=Ascaris lumbricoides TaxID=6252 RepID=A0A0M3I2A6_ASCLU
MLSTMRLELIFAVFLLQECTIGNTSRADTVDPAVVMLQHMWGSVNSGINRGSQSSQKAFGRGLLKQLDILRELERRGKRFNSQLNDYEGLII